MVGVVLLDMPDGMDSERPHHVPVRRPQPDADTNQHPDWRHRQPEHIRLPERQLWLPHELPRRDRGRPPRIPGSLCPLVHVLSQGLELPEAVKLE